ncbi:hypothetical protein G7K_1770-t1 [Saitoella complicata NRRL Y-17804]|uniref:Cytochrome c oxidase assembly protein subunit 15 n=2 Tax=Saitoella complicata (strain BCRC 22490 / CBS 7301 / JCM 7358 / NBRC 10748 / NRRL Y-17804) TaxID=698492 RepID=A0A0E9NCH1_SAICN|nr:hypothetical protein G7K_1770-t1 [Saitoella complicata NRRL Y-17804]
MFRSSICASCRLSLRSTVRRPATTFLSASAPLAHRANIAFTTQATFSRFNSTRPTSQNDLITKLAHGLLVRRAASTASAEAPPAEAPSPPPSPPVNSKATGYWLLFSASLVFGIVVIGGLTRLTESGLSITEWKPVTGTIPPLTHAEWETEFAKYKNSPEYKVLRSEDMTLAEFQYIFGFEWAHRVWGRAIGLVFVVPTLYLIARRRVTPRIAKRLLGIGALIGFQGFIGWWMVASGLKDELLEEGKHPRVSQYRLATHLGTAFLVYVAMLNTGLEILKSHAKSLPSNELLSKPELRPFRRYTHFLMALVFLTALSGAFVAGLDAGMIYNEFPTMGGPGRLAPPLSDLFSSDYATSPDHSDLYWRNFLENPVLVQLDHRILATTTFFATLALWIYSKRLPLLPLPAKRAADACMALVTMQVALGISTLLMCVPIPLAAAHQAGSLALLTGTLVLGSRVQPVRRAIASQNKAMKAAGVVGLAGMYVPGRRIEGL